MGKYYLYNVNYKKEDALKAFSVTDAGKIYFYNMDYAKFRNPLGLSDVCPISVISGAYAGRAIIFYAAAKRKREIRAYYDHIRNFNVFDKVINEHLEDKVGFEITRITSVKEMKSYALIKYRYIEANGKEKAELMTIYNNLNDYDELISAMKKLRDRTKDKCAKCGSFLVDGVCENCGSKEVAKENNGAKAYLTGAIIFGLLAVLSVVMQYTGDAAEEKMSTIMIISKVMLFVGPAFAAGCGVEYYKRK